MAKKSQPGKELVDTGKPNDPAKKENPDTRPGQLKPDNGQAPPGKDDNDPALTTTREAGQGTG